MPYFLSLLILFSFVYPVQAQVLEHAEVTQNVVGKRVVVTGSHAPWSEIIVVDDLGNVIASGIFPGASFRLDFTATLTQTQTMSIFAVDQASQTAPVPLDPSGGIDIVLPPSLVIDESIPITEEQVRVAGYSVPGARVTIEVINDQGDRQILTTIAEDDGGWSADLLNLEPGDYLVDAVSEWGQRSSQASIDLSVIIDRPPLVEPPKVVSDVTQAVEDVVSAVLPDPVIETVKEVAPQAEQVAQVVTPVASAGLVTQLFLALRNISYVAIQAGISLLQYFGFWKKRNPWGVVYDAITKRPINLATVRLYEVLKGQGSTKRLIETDVSSKSGVFSFTVPGGVYTMLVQKPGYRFPTKFIGGQVDGEYQNVYHGEQLKLSSESLVSVSIPLDPENYTELSLRERLVLFIRQRISMLTNVLLVVGLMLSVLAVVGGRGKWHLLWMVFYIVILFTQWYVYQRKKHQWGVVTDQNGDVVDGVQLNLLDPQFNKLVQRRVTDSEGKYQFVVPAGKYRISIENPGVEFDQTKTGVYRGEDIVIEGEKPKLLALKIAVIVDSIV